ncbi:MAG TPA: hypothetical protein VKQ10_05100 [Spirochaetota bacterium]|nr:hypothetical protein [Spirochaetota bacterium]
MQREILFDNIDTFIQELQTRGIQKIACAEVNEKRVVQLEEDKLEVQGVVILDLLAYKSPTIFKCTLKDVNTNEICSALEQKGFEITRRSRNII